MIDLTNHDLDVIHYGGMALAKLVVILFFLFSRGWRSGWCAEGEGLIGPFANKVGGPDRSRCPPDLRPRRQVVRLDLAVGKNVLDADAVGQQVVADQSPVALPVQSPRRT